MIRVVCEVGVQDATVAQVISTAGVSRRTFYELFADRDECMLAAIEQTCAVAAKRASVACAVHDVWVDRVRAGLWALLEFFEEDPHLAHLCVVYMLQGSPRTLARRQEICNRLARLLDDARIDCGRDPSPLTAEATVGGALAVVHTRLLERSRPPLTDLLGPLMGFIVLPYLGTDAARAERSRPLPRRSAPHRRDTAVDPLDDAPIRLTYRTMRVLAAIAAEPGLKNSHVSELAGIADEGQTSKLLARLARVGLIENIGAGVNRNAPKAWRLTPAGEHLERSIRRELP
jgi:AcrR family transcriptional regulator